MPTAFQHRLGNGVLCRRRAMSRNAWTTPTFCMSVKSRPTNALARWKKVSVASTLCFGLRSEN
jgi:hypothetical protein